MSFLSRIKDLGKSRDEDEVQPEALVAEGLVTADGAQTVDTQTSHSGLPTSAQEESIISEAAPSEFPADYHDTRLRPEVDLGDQLPPEPKTNLPLIGNLGLERQQRLLVGGVILGVIGLVASAMAALAACKSPPPQAPTAQDSKMPSRDTAAGPAATPAPKASAAATPRDTQRAEKHALRGVDAAVQVHHVPGRALRRWRQQPLQDGE